MKSEIFKKEDHIEISTGGTYIISSKKCPLKESEVALEDNIFIMDGKKVPCCVLCTSFNDWKYEKCKYFDKVILDKGKFTCNCLKQVKMIKFIYGVMNSAKTVNLICKAYELKQRKIKWNPRPGEIFFCGSEQYGSNVDIIIK